MSGTKIEKTDSECTGTEDLCQADCELCCRTNQELPRSLYGGDQGAISIEEELMDESDAVTKSHVGSMHREAYVTFNEGHMTIPETWNGASIGHDTKQSATECLHPLPLN